MLLSRCPIKPARINARLPPPPFLQVRKDANLANVRKSPRFKPLMDKYDEPIINEAAIKAFTSLFSFGKKSDSD